MQNKHYAQQLYMAGGRSQKEIATLTGVSERTVYTWIHQFAWDKLRLATLQAPATIADNICAQLVEIQDAIAGREPGKRYPTMEEAEITRKLITSLEKMKKYPSASQHMQVLETFRNYIRPADKEFAKQLALYTTKFLSAKSINGFAPYQLEYGVSPVDPYYEEPEEDEVPSPIPCPNVETCLHPHDCDYPSCRAPKKQPAPDPLITYSVPAFHFHPQSQHPDKECINETKAAETGIFSAITATPLQPLPTPLHTTSFPKPPFPHTPLLSTSLNNTNAMRSPEVSGSNPAIPPPHDKHI